jgi:hypothetical protein
MALTVSILRQPLYGFVFWNGLNFNYTPNQGFSGSDSFVYSEYIDGTTNVYTKYVNTANTPPNSLSVILSANSHETNVINVNSVVRDETNPFNALKFIEASAISNTEITTDGDNLYYKPYVAGVLDIITYKATDRQFTITGTISVNVLSAAEGAPYSYSPLERLHILSGITTSYEHASSGWTASYNIYAQYGTIWDNFDLDKYNNFSNTVVDRYTPWNSIYDYRNIYYSVYTTTTEYSGNWNDIIDPANYYYGIINPKSILWNSVYNILQSNSSNFNNSITNFNRISSGLEYTQPFYDRVYNTVRSSSADIWDNTNINNWYSSNANLLRNTYTYTSSNSSKWIAPVSGFQSLSSGVSDVVAGIKSTSNSVYSNSGSLWDNSNLNELSAIYYDKWTLSYVKLTSSREQFDIFSASVDSISAGLDSTNQNTNSLTTTVSSNSGSTWNNSSNVSLLSSNSANWYGAYNTLISSSAYWNNDTSILSTINNQSPIFDTGFNIVTSNSSSNWSNLSNNYTQILNNSSNYTSNYNLLSSTSGTWNVSLDIINTISSNSAVFNEFYNLIISNSASLWSNSNNTLLSSNSGNWNILYTLLTQYSGNWNSSSDIGTIIASNISYFNSVYNTVISNSSSLWSNSNNILLSSNSGNWSSSYNILTSYSGAWSIGNSLSVTIMNDSIRYVSTYNTLSANSGNNWTGMSIYQSISDNVSQFENLKYLFYTIDSDSAWSSMPQIYNEIFSSYNLYYSRFISTSNSVSANSSFWDTTYVNNILSPISSNLISNYNLLNSNSSYWKFTEDQSLKNTYSYVSSSSARLNSESTLLTDKVSTWSDSFNNSNLTTLSSKYLTGGNDVNLSARNISIFGNLVVTQNLSALGSKTSINTSNYSLTGFEVTDTSTTDCFVISKPSNLNYVATFSSVSSGPVLAIKADNTVYINGLSGKQALNVFGDISASGNITNYLGSQITLLQNNSSKYDSAYSFVTTNSAYLTAFNASKYIYDDMVNYVNISSSNINTLTSSKTNSDSMYFNVSSNYIRNLNTNTFVTYSTANINIDTIYRTLTGKYDSTYNSLTSTSAGQIVSLNYLFSFNKPVSSDKAKLMIPYNLRIDSWSVFTDVPTNLSIDVLCCFGFNKTIKRLSITSNQPITASNAIKATANQLDTLGWFTNIKEGGFIEFNLTKNDSASAVMVNLKAYKI